MSNFLTSMSFVLFFLLATYGAGRLWAQLVSSKEAKTGWAYATSLGIGLWLVYGGVLNFLQLVTPLTLRYSLYSGATLALGFVCLELIGWRQRRQAERATTPPPPASAPHPAGHLPLADLFFSGVVIAILIFCVYYLMPAKAFNFHDDFHYYFHPSKQLLANGTLKFNILSALGINEMGGQVFMKAFPLLAFDDQYANTFDAIICFTLCIGLLIEIGKNLQVNNFFITISIVLFAIINPQIVNTTSCYSGSLMIIGISYSLLLLNQYYLPTSEHSYAKAIMSVSPVAVFYAAIATLKSTFIVFVLLLFTLYLLLDFVLQPAKKTVVMKNLCLSIMALCLLAPWLFAPSTKYLYTLQNKLTSWWAGNSPPPVTVAGQPTPDVFFSSLFSTGELFWGNSFHHYAAILLTLVLTACLALCRWSRRPRAESNGETAFLPAAALAAFFTLYLFGGLVDPQTALRYVLPILIALMSVSTLLVGKYFCQGSQGSLRIGGLGILATHLIIGGMFSGTFVERVKKIAQQRTVISFPMSPQYGNFMRFIFSRERAEQIHLVQSTIAAGKSVMAWITTPFYLDFARNNITTLEVCDTIGGAFTKEIPYDVDIETFWKFFRDRGIEYIMWEYDGFAVKNDQWYLSSGALKELYFKKTLPLLANYTKVIYDNNSIAVLDISEFHRHNPNLKP